MTRKTRHGLFAALSALTMLITGCDGSQAPEDDSSYVSTTTPTPGGTGTGGNTGGTDTTPLEIPQTISLSLQLAEPGSASSRSLMRTAVGTFEEVTAIHVNVKRQGRESLVYAAPGVALTGSGANWSGNLDGLILNGSYTFYISAMKVSGVEIFTGQTTHTVQSGTNTINVTLNPVLNDLEIAVPKIVRLNYPETIGKGLSASVVATVENGDSGTLSWSFEVYSGSGFGAVSSCPATNCGSFAPTSGNSMAGSDNVTASGSKHTHQLGSTYSAPDSVSEQRLRVMVSNKARIGVESRFSIKVTGPISSGITLNAAPAVLTLTALRVQDNASCPDYDCLALITLVDDDGAFSELSASWDYTFSRGQTFSNTSKLVSASDATQGHFSAVLNDYRDGDSGSVVLTVTDAGGRQGVLNFPLVPGAYPLTPRCNASGNDCMVPQGPGTPRFLVLESSSGQVREQNATEVDNQWIPVWESAPPTVSYSTDGIAWQRTGFNDLITLQHDPTIVPSPDSVVYDTVNSRFVAVDNHSTEQISFSSTDGVTWNQLSVQNTPTTDNSTGIIGKGHLVAGGSKLLLVDSQEATYGWAYKHSDGTITNSSYYNGNCCGQHGWWKIQSGRMMTLLSSDGGLNWAAGNDNVSITLIHNNGSSENWTPSPSSVVYDSSNSRFVAVDNSSDNSTPGGKTIISSADGSTWSKLSTIDNSTHTLYGDVQLIAGGSKLLLVGSQEATYGWAYKHSDGTITNSSYSNGNCCGQHGWWEIQSGRMMTLLSSDGGLNWAAGNDNVSITLTHDNGSSENWIPSPDSVVYDSSNSRYVAVDSSSLGWIIISSANGSTWSKLSTIDNSTRPLYGDPQLITGGSKLLLVGSQEETYGWAYKHSDGTITNSSYYNGNCCGQHGWWEIQPARMMTLLSSDGGVNWAAGNDNVKVNIRYQTQERLQQGPYVFGKREYLMATGNEVKHQEGDAVVIAASQDGFSWTQYSLIPKVVLKAPVTHLAYGNRRYVLISSRPQQRVYKYVEGYGNTQVLEPDLMQTLVSDNGSDWTTGNRGVEILSATGWQPIAPNNISFLGGKFYSYDSDMAIRSTDGIDWEVVPIEAEESQDGEELENVAFGNGVFVALVSVANYNYCYWSWPHYGSGHWPECGGSKESIFYHSTNGENWTVVSFASSSDNVTVASSSDNVTVDNVTNNKIVVFFEQVGNGGYNVIKPELVDIKFGNGRFIAWDNRTAVVSTDGQNWTLHSITVPTINNSAGYPVPEFVMSFDNQTVYGEPQGALTPPSSDGKPRVVRIGPSGNPETGSSNYVSRSRAKKVFVTFSEPVTIGKTGDSTSWSGTESCTNFDVQYHREGESNCYQLNAAPTTLGTNFTAGGKVFNKTWVLDFGQEPNCCSTHEIRVKASPTLTDQQGNSLAEDFVTRIRF